jgi:hypothetical protein
MRIPLRKIYRAFPELDRFDDEECERFVIQATRVRWTIRLAKLMLQIAVAVIVGLMVLVAGVFALAMFQMRDDSDTAIVAVTIALGVMLGAGPGICVLLLRDWMLRRAIAGRIRLARCPQCDYLLLGLPCREGHVMCPECGMNFGLAEYGLTEADLVCRAEGV